MAAVKCCNIANKLPIVVILGSTGTGKSKLAIELAKRFNGEIVSADSMQVYKGLDIITNKVTKEEQAEVPHHMLSFLEPKYEYTIVDFRNKVLNIIDELINRQKLPIIVGGTNYYIESILFKILVSDEISSGGAADDSRKRPGSPRHANDGRKCLDINSDSDGSSRDLDQGRIPEKKTKLDDHDEEDDDDDDGEKFRKEAKGVPTEELYERLKAVDPKQAERLHPKDRRKVLRSLELFEKHGKRHSELIEEQKSLPGGNSLGGPLRFENSVVFWLQCDQAVLDARLDARVDEMLAQGLIDELLDFHKRYNEQRLLENKLPDYTKGIFQSIGFKEFHEYLILSEEKRQSEEGQKLFEKCVETLKLVTRRYARLQIKWVTNRFLKKPDRKAPPLYSLNTTDVSHWKENVYDVAESVLGCLLKNEKPPVDPLPMLPPLEKEYKRLECEICSKIFVDTFQYDIHMKSKKHQKGLKKRKKEEERKELEKQCEVVKLEPEDLN